MNNDLRMQWEGILHSRRHSGVEVTLRAPISQAHAGGSCPFLGAGNDGHRYWIKPLNNQQSPRVPITEQIVGRIGTLIDAPVCSVKLIEITEECSDWEFMADRLLEPGIAHGSQQISGARDTYVLGNRRKDDNRTRHCYFMALYDWCWGDDAQWLEVPADDYSYYSHDHGFYLPPGTPDWSITSLLSAVDEPHELDDRIGDIDALTAVTVAGKIEAVTRSQICQALSAVPSTWPVTDEELETVGFFLEARAAGVANRLRSRFRGAT